MMDDNVLNGGTVKTGAGLMTETTQDVLMCHISYNDVKKLSCCVAIPLSVHSYIHRGSWPTAPDDIFSCA